MNMIRLSSYFLTGFASRGSLSYRVDKCLVILHDMLERRGEVKLTLDDMQRTFGNLSGQEALEISADECTWIGFFQVMY